MDKENDDAMNVILDFIGAISANSVDIDNEFSKIVDVNFWDLF